MDIRQLEAFVYTAKYQSFSLAAQKLYLSQPTVSSHICNLEKELHTQLLQRTTKALSMTPAGRRLYSYAAEILDLRHKAVLELTSQQEAMLHIGVSSVPSLHLLPELLAAYHVQAPEVRFRTSCSDSLDVIRKVSEGGCDIGLAGTKTAAPGCGFLPVTSDELVLAAPNTPHFREYQQQKEPLRALLREPFLLREDNSGTKQETLYFLRHIGLSLDEPSWMTRPRSSAASRSAWVFPSCRARPCRTMRSRADCCCFRWGSRLFCAGFTSCIRPRAVCRSRRDVFWIS